MKRREFIHDSCKALGMTALAAGLGKFNLITAPAQTASDYKALVCIFLFGGNDANNMIVPLEPDEYAAYAAVRDSGSGIQLAQSSLEPIVPASLGRQFGLHPSLRPLVPVWNKGHLSAVVNVGTLVEPMTREQYINNLATKPASLFSHSDQQSQWQASESLGFPSTGWGGRLADRTVGLNGSALYPVVTSVAGNNLFLNGSTTRPITLPSTGSFGLRGFNNSAASQARRAALLQILAQDRSATLVDAASEEMESAIELSAIIDPIINSTSSRVERLFAKQTANLSRQLLRVAKIIERRATLGVRRQIFFCTLGGFDTHNGQAGTQASLFTQLAVAMRTFYDATVKLGVEGNVTTFTLSDFGRTLRPASGGGTDHAWGSHHFVMGGAVRGADFYGTWPTLALGGPDDTGSDGRWIPTISVDQYAATLATWYGASPSDLPEVLPNIGNFATNDLGFFVIE